MNNSAMPPSEDPDDQIPAPIDKSVDDEKYADQKDAGRGEIVTYSLGGIIDELTTSGFRNLNTLLIIAYQVSPLIVGFIGAIKTIWDGLMDPLVAHWSDNCNSRFGRRRPFILAGGVLMAVVAWMTWAFMPENENLQPNEPVVPTVYFVDKIWENFSYLQLAYAVPEYDVTVEIDEEPGSEDYRTLKLLAEESIKDAAGDTKALVRLRNESDVSSAEPLSGNPLLRLSFKIQNQTPPDIDPYSARLTVRGEADFLEEALVSEIDITTSDTLHNDAERDENLINKIVYLFTDKPEEGSLKLESDDTLYKSNLLIKRNDERAVKAAVMIGIIETVSQSFGLPYHRILPEDAQLSARIKTATLEQAQKRLGSEKGYLKQLMISDGLKIDLTQQVSTTEQTQAFADYNAKFGDKPETEIFLDLYESLPVREGGSRQALIRNPKQTRQFKGIWTKIGDGFSTFTDADPQQRKFLYFVMGMFLLMAIGSTLYNAAYYALGIEIAPSYHGRTRVVGYRSVANGLINIVTQFFLPLSLLPIFMNAEQGSLFLVYILAPMGLILAVGVFFGTKERTVIIHNKQKKPNFFKCIVQIGRNREFWRITGLYLFIGYAIGSFNGLGGLISIYYVFEGNMVLGASYGAIAGILGTVLSMASIPLFVWLCKKIGKHVTLRLALGSLAAGSCLKFFCYNPEYPELMFFPPLFYSPAIGGFYNVLSTMMGDVTDVDELRNGERREGMFGAVMAVIIKSLGSFSAIAAGLIIVASGFEITKGVHQDPGVYFNMRVMFSVVPGICSLGGFALLYKYPLTHARVDEIKQQLKVLRRQRDSGRI